MSEFNPEQLLLKHLKEFQLNILITKDGALWNCHLAAITEAHQLGRDGQKYGVAIICPFCGRAEFDKEGLKYHLANYCEPYNTTPNI